MGAEYVINRLGTTCSTRGEKIAEVQQRLTEINKKYPGERAKKEEERDPRYTAARTATLAMRRILDDDQKTNRREIGELCRLRS